MKSAAMTPHLVSVINKLDPAGGWEIEDDLDLEEDHHRGLHLGLAAGYVEQEDHPSGKRWRLTEDGIAVRAQMAANG